MPLPLLTATRGFALVAIAAALACSGESGPPEPARARPLVLVSVAPHGYFVESLSAGAAEVVALLPPGASPTSFEPGIDALRAIGHASLLVLVGHPHFPFERAWLAGLLREQPELRVVDAHAAADSDERAREDPAQVQLLDPHAWLSPTAAISLVEALVPELARLLGDEEGVRARGAGLRREIEALERELRATLEPVRGGQFLVLHPAWGHFAQHFGLRQVAIERDGKPPGPRELARLVDDAARNGLRSVIVVPQIDPAQASSLARALGGRVVELDPLAPDWPDNMRRTARLLAAEAVVPVVQ